MNNTDMNGPLVSSSQYETDTSFQGVGNSRVLINQRKNEYSETLGINKKALEGDIAYLRDTQNLYRNASKEAANAIDTLGEAFKDLTDLEKKYKKELDTGNISIEKAAQLINEYNRLRKQTAEIEDYVADAVKRADREKKKITKEEINRDLRRIKKRYAEQAKLDAAEEKRILQEAKNAQRKQSQIVAQGAKDALSQLHKVVDTISDLNLARNFAPSARVLTQRSLMQNYGLTATEFDEFKHGLYNQVDKSLYSSEQIISAMQTLNTTALKNTQSATQAFKQIVEGQNILGISAETQQELIKLSNKTGRDELSFYQDKVAKYLNSSLGLNKQQLSELIGLNATMQAQAADIGISTRAFTDMSTNEQAAFEMTQKGAGSIYTSAMSSLFANTNTTSALLGMSSGDLASYLANGGSLIEALKSGAGSAQAIATLQSGDAKTINDMYEYAKDAWGVSSEMWSLLKIIAQNGTELNNNYMEAIKADSKDSNDVWKELRKQYGSTVTFLAKGANLVDNFFSDVLGWTLEDNVSHILAVTTAILGVLASDKLFGGIKSLLGSSGTLGHGLFSTVTKTGGIGKMTLGSAGAGVLKAAGSLGGLAWTGYDAIKGGFSGIKDASGNQIIKSGIGSAAISAFSGSSVSGSSAVNIGGGALSGAAKGALIGTVFGPVGMGIGAAIGGVGGLIAGIVKDNARKAHEDAEETNKTLKDVKDNTASTADKVSLVTTYRNSSLNMGEAGPGIGSDGNWVVTSSYGYRNINGKKSWHTGVDYAGKPYGTNIGSATDGVVKKVVSGHTWNDGTGKANYVDVLNEANGLIYRYYHLASTSVQEGQNIKAGQVIGRMGNTGNVLPKPNAQHPTWGTHLHFGVLKNGKDINPMPYVTDSIFNPGVYSSASSQASTNATDAVSAALTEDANHSVKLRTLAFGSDTASTPIVNSITDLKNTIIALNDKVNTQEKIMQVLTQNRTNPTY